MLYVKAFHIIAMVAWFAGLFYLPRLFVYHTAANDKISLDRFKIMEKRLYYAITWPAAIVTSILGVSLITYNPQYYLSQYWMHAKLGLIVLLWIYHLSCGHFLKLFAAERSRKSGRFFRMYNEVPTVLLIAIVILVIAKPF